MWFVECIICIPHHQPFTDGAEKRCKGEDDILERPSTGPPSAKDEEDNQPETREHIFPVDCVCHTSIDLLWVLRSWGDPMAPPPESLLSTGWQVWKRICIFTSNEPGDYDLRMDRPRHATIIAITEPESMNYLRCRSMLAAAGIHAPLSRPRHW